MAKKLRISTTNFAVNSLETVAYNSYCNTVEWFWWDSNLPQWQTSFCQCIYTVGSVIWLVKIIPEMTYEVSSGMLTQLNRELWTQVSDTSKSASLLYIIIN